MSTQPKKKAKKKKVKKILANRGDQIDAAVNKAQTGTPKKKKVAPKKNPYPKGSARAKMWARKQKDNQ